MANTIKSLSNLPGFTPVDNRQENFVRYAEGIGKVRPDGKGLSIAMNVFDPAGVPDGTQICSGDVVGAASLDDFAKQPAHQPVVFGENGPIPEVAITTRCKATWTFQNGSTISAIGKGTSHLIPLKPNATSLVAGNIVARAGVMKDKAAMVITEGTGEFAGARGTVSLDSSVFLPDVKNVPFGKPGSEVHQKSIHTFDVVRAQHIA